MTMAKACKLRTLQWDNHTAGGLAVESRAEALQQALLDTEELVRTVRWAAWLDRPFLFNLQRNREACRGQGARCSRLLHELTRGAPRPWPLHTLQQARCNFQRAALAALEQPCAAEVQVRLRTRFFRWRLTIFPRTCSTRASRVLARLARLVPPRVLAAVLRLWWNGWITPRRFQQAERSCLFCGQVESVDALEHIMCCRVVWAFSGRFLRQLCPIGQAAHRRAAFLLIDHTAFQDDACLTLGAIRVAATYTIHNTLRTTAPSDPDTTVDMLAQAAKECVRGQGWASRCLDSVWNTN